MLGVQIVKADLLRIIRDNRDKHEADYDAAERGYRQAVLQKLYDLMATIEAGGKVKTGVHLPENAPESHVAEYDRVIRMLEMSVDDVATLDEEDFRQYVEDKWHWSEEFSSSCSSYSSSSVSGSGIRGNET